MPIKTTTNNGEATLAVVSPTVAAPVSEKPVGKLHLDYLDGLRAVAALYVLLFHAQGQISGMQSRAINTFRSLFGFGHYAVDLFIVLSGFCLALPVIRQGVVLRGGPLLFFKKRARRILPPYYITVALSLGLIWTVIGQKTGTPWDNSVPVTKTDILAHLLVVQDMVPGAYSTINHSLWSISVEWRIYFLFPLLVYCWRRFGLVRTTGATMAASVLLVIALAKTIGPTFTSQYVGLFGLGMLGAGIAYSAEGELELLRRRVPWDIASVLTFMVVVALSKARVWHHDIAPLEFTDYFVGLFALSLLIMLSQQTGRGLRGLLEWRPLVFIGGFSYSLYLMHAPLLQILWQYVFHPLGLSGVKTFLLQVFIGAPIIVGLTYAFYLGCERPFLNHPAKKGAA